MFLSVWCCPLKLNVTTFLSVVVKIRQLLVSRRSAPLSHVLLGVSEHLKESSETWGFILDVFTRREQLRKVSASDNSLKIFFFVCCMF